MARYLDVDGDPEVSICPLLVQSTGIRKRRCWLNNQLSSKKWPLTWRIRLFFSGSFIADVSVDFDSTFTATWMEGRVSNVSQPQNARHRIPTKSRAEVGDVYCQISEAAPLAAGQIPSFSRSFASYFLSPMRCNSIFLMIRSTRLLTSWR